MKIGISGDGSQFSKLIEYVIEQTMVASRSSDGEFIKQYEASGFTREDYEEMKALTKEPYTLWIAPELAKKKGTTP